MRKKERKKERSRRERKKKNFFLTDDRDREQRPVVRPHSLYHPIQTTPAPAFRHGPQTTGDDGGRGERKAGHGGGGDFRQGSQGPREAEGVGDEGGRRPDDVRPVDDDG